MIDLAVLRADTPGCASVTHLNNAGSALPPRVVTDTAVAHVRREEEIGGYEAHAEAADRVAAVYDSVARLVHAPRERVALVESATAAWDRGLQAIAFSQDIEPGDRFLVSAAEYASNVIPLLQLAQRTGGRVEFIPDGADGTTDVEALGAMLDERVRIVAITHAPSQNGLLNDVVGIGDMLRINGSPAWYIVDACQSAGQIPLDMGRIGCDVLSATGRKFLRGPRGTGFLVVSQRLLDEAEPFPLDLHGATWESELEFAVQPGARRFESWEKSYAALLGMGAAIDYALECGIDELRARIDTLAQGLRARLSEIPGVRVRDRGEIKTGIVTISAPDPAAIVAGLRAKGINTSHSTPDYARHDFAQHGITGLVRISPHAYNTDEELDRAVAAISRLLPI
ncbi:MAG: aminotransferase class V-fold PLP-dependent enzyme [Actinobacteria bacterium]|nr:aminotransferase class V-fold PLP-dependent enzyme [Actinomycetota bacterium]